MYESFYHLDGNPFRLVPDSRFCFRHPSYDEAQAYLEYAFKLGEGFVIFTGRPGTGKTTLVQSFLKRLRPSEVHAARIAVTNLNATELLRSVANAFGLDSERCDKVILLRRLEQHFLAQVHAGKRNLLIIDEAQGLSMSSLEELRMLADLQTESRFLLQIFLVGHEKLREFMVAPDMEQFQQRVAGTCKLVPLALKECRSYIEYRLCQVGWNGDPVFTGPAVQAIHRYSEGVPRHINKVCTRLLLHGLLENRHELNEADVLTVARGLEEELLAPLSSSLPTVEDKPVSIAAVNDDALEAENSEDKLAIMQRQVSRPKAEPEAPVSLREETPQPAVDAPPRRETPDRPPASASVRTESASARTEAETRAAWPLVGTTELRQAGRQLKDMINRRSRSDLEPAMLLGLSGVVVLFMLVMVFNTDPTDDGGLRAMQSDDYDTWVQVSRYRDGVFEEYPVYEEPEFVRENRARRAEQFAQQQAAQPPAVETAPPETVTVARAEPVKTPVPVESVMPVQPEPVVVVARADIEPQPAPRLDQPRTVEPVLNDVSLPRPDEEEKVELVQRTVVEEPVVAEVLVEAPPVEQARAEVRAETTVLTGQQLPPEQVVVVAEAVPATVEPATTEPAEPPVSEQAVQLASLELNKEAEVSRLLLLARKSVKDYRLLIPVGDNAYEYYLQVDALDPGNKEAAKGISRIVARYYTLAERAFAKDDLKSAQVYIDRGLRIQPGNEELLALQTALVNPRIEYVEVASSSNSAAQTTASPQEATLFSRVKNFFEKDQIGVVPDTSPWHDEDSAW